MLSTPEDDDNEVLRHGLPTGFINFNVFVPCTLMHSALPPW